MELKKNEKLNLERKTPLFFTIGLVTSMTLVIVAFEWRSEFDVLVIEPIIDEPTIDLTRVIATRHVEPEPPKPEKKEKTMKKPSEQPPVFIPQNEVVEIEKAVAVNEESIDVSDFIEELGDEVAEDDPNAIVDIVESMPKFPGGDEAFLEYLAKEIKYPRKASRLGIQGTVYVQFVINKDGSITDLEVIRGIGAGCDVESIRVLENSPIWVPGKQRGRPVRVRKIVPIKFSLR